MDDHASWAKIDNEKKKTIKKRHHHLPVVFLKFVRKSSEPKVGRQLDRMHKPKSTTGRSSNISIVGITEQSGMHLKSYFLADFSTYTY